MGPAQPVLDLRGTPCPLNFIRTQLALEKLAPGAELHLLLDAGEPDKLLQEGFSEAGAAAHLVASLQRRQEPDGAVHFCIIRG